MNSEKLIEIVRSHSSLYDLGDPKYSDATHKDKLWKTIGDELNQPGNYLFYLNTFFIFNFLFIKKNT